jgi:hypothetical protein
MNTFSKMAEEWMRANLPPKVLPGDSATAENPEKPPEPEAPKPPKTVFEGFAGSLPATVAITEPVKPFPRCPRCVSYALYRPNNIGNYECQTCGLPDIPEDVARWVN